MESTGKNIVLGVTGSIAAYKAVELLRLLTGRGHEVSVVLTPAGRRFVGEVTFQALSGKPVHWDQFSPGDSSVFPHIELARSDLLVVAPATATTIAKMAAGIADNLLLSTFLASRCPVIVCPAMNEGMWRHPAVKENMETLRRRGVMVVGPATGDLACGDEGEGRLAEPEDIIAAIETVLGGKAGTSVSQKDLAGRRILITAGATREPIDSVRYITNRSSGRMGLALARAALDRGADVTVIAANCALKRPDGARYLDVSTSDQLKDLLDKEFELNDVLIMAAAVADYKVSAGETKGKLGRDVNNSLQLVPTSDIVSHLGDSSNGKLKVGFAAEFGKENLERARDKLKAKNLDMIVFNDISRQDIGFESGENEIVIMAPGIEDIYVEKTGKLECANRILDRIKELLG